MSSIVKNDESGEQVFMSRSDWFSAEACQMLEDACDNPAVGPEKTLAMILHHGLGLPLSLVGKLMKCTKNVIAKQVITGKRELRKTEATSASAQSPARAL